MSDLPTLTPGNVAEAMKGIKAGETKLALVEIEYITRDPRFDVRVKDDAYWSKVNLLVASYGQTGFWKDKPLAGYVTKDPASGELAILLIDGNRRMDGIEAFNVKAADESKIKRVPMVVFPPATSYYDLLAYVTTAGRTGEQLTPYEQGILARSMLGAPGEKGEKFTAVMVANRLDVTERFLSDILALADGPEEIHKMVRAGQVSSTLAITEIRKNAAHPALAVKRLQDALALAKADGKTAVTAKYLPKPAPKVVAGAPVSAPVKVDDKILHVELIKYVTDTLMFDTPAGGMEFLVKWLARDPETVKAFEEHLKIPAGSTDLPKKRIIKPPKTKRVRKPAAEKTDAEKAADKSKKDAAKKQSAAPVAKTAAEKAADKKAAAEKAKADKKAAADAAKAAKATTTAPKRGKGAAAAPPASAPAAAAAAVDPAADL